MDIQPFRLQDPPVIEAIVDVDCAFDGSPDLASISSDFRELVVSKYPKHSLQFQSDVAVEQAADGVVSTQWNNIIAGHRFISTDEKQLVQCRITGFSFNRLAPYSTFNEIAQELEKLWGDYVKVAKPVDVIEARLRYINRIDIPIIEDGIKLTDYFTAFPDLNQPSGISLAGFLWQSTGVEKATENHVRVAMANQPPQNGKCSIILDIEAKSIRRQNPLDWQAILQRLESLRLLKNRVFKESLTEKCIQLFQPHS